MDSKNGLSRWIGQHQLISFFLLSFGISWGLLMTLGPLYATGIRR